MLNSKALRNALKHIFGIDDKFLVPLNSGWYTPTTDPKEKVGTWIGYRINSVKPYARAFGGSIQRSKPVKIHFRISFVGPQAEDLAMSTIMWEDRTDVQKIFERYETQINYNERQVFSYPVRNEGFNDMLCWIVDFTAQSSYEVNIERKPWFPHA